MTDVLTESLNHGFIDDQMFLAGAEAAPAMTTQTNQAWNPTPDYYGNGPTTTQGYGQPLGPPGVMCSPNAHYFGCKHERYCACGMTSRRVDQTLPEGL